MKAFVYMKNNKSKKIAMIENVVKVVKENQTIRILDNQGSTYKFNTKKVKTSIYQN